MADLTTGTTQQADGSQQGGDLANDFKQADSQKTDDGTAAQNPYLNKALISKRIDKRLAVDKFSRSLFERSWFRNLLLKVGQHNIIWDKGQWRLRRLPSWYPARVQTNKFAEKGRDILSAILQNGRTPIRYLPATEDPADQGIADVGERVREVIYSEAKIDSKESELGSWFVDTGNAFLMLDYDYDERHGTFPMNKLECPTCQSQFGLAEMEQIDEQNPVCPNCAQQGTSSPLQASQETELAPIGALTADPCSGFEIRLDHRIRDLDDHTWFCRVKRYDEKFAKDKWGYDDGPNDTGETGNLQSQHYLDILAQVTDAFNPAGGTQQTGVSGAANKPKKVTAYMFFEFPTPEFPEGLRAVRIGPSENHVVEAGPLNFKYGAGIRKDKPFLNLIFFGAETIPGRFWRKTPLDDAVPLQIYRNVVEAIIRLTVQRMGNPFWLNPKGSGIENFNGEPGWIAHYNPVSLGGTSFAKPERVPAELNNLPGLLALLKFIDDSIERVTGTYFLQGGDSPPGVTAASALGLLDERSKKAMSPLTREWAKGWLRFEMLALEIAREHWTEDRIRLIAGKNKKWQTQKFSAADLQGAVNMQIDYESLFPRSAATNRAEIGQLIQEGVITPQDPQQKAEILKAYGKMNLLGSFDKDIEEANKEEDLFLTKNVQPQLVPLVQNSAIHLAQHADFAKTDEFKELPPQQQQMWFAHIKAHAADMVARRIFLSQLQIDPDSPAAETITSGEAQAGFGSGLQLYPQAQNASKQAGAQVGSSGPKGPGAGPTGDGANQDKARAAQASQPIPDIGA